jgi:hypothetical protein
MDFTELPIANGLGAFHVNQFRIHFSIPGFRGDTSRKIPELVSEFVRDFPRFFNGDEKNLKKNKAAVAWSTKRFSNKSTLRFVLDMEIESIGLNVPDLHSDWVYALWQDANKGFAAQTLKRNFFEAADLAVAALPPPLGGILGQYNTYHFLAGRRSWVFGTVGPGLPGLKPGGMQVGRMEGGRFVPQSGTPDTVFFLESSAVERSSALLFQLMEKDRGLMINMREAIVTIWSTLLSNYVQAKGFRLNVGHPMTYQQDDGANRWESSPTWRGVYFRREEFSSAQALNTRRWVGYLLDLHPALRSQPLTASQFRGFGGGRSGGGGAGSSW